MIDHDKFLNLDSTRERPERQMPERFGIFRNNIIPQLDHCQICKPTWSCYTIIYMLYNNIYYLQSLYAAMIMRTSNKTPNAPSPTPISSEPGVASAARMFFVSSTKIKIQKCEILRCLGWIETVRRSLFYKIFDLSIAFYGGLPFISCGLSGSFQSFSRDFMF